MALTFNITPTRNTSLDGDNIGDMVTLSVTITLVVFIIITVLGNTLVCYAFYKQPNIRRVCYYPIISLAVADILCGVVAMPSYIAKKQIPGDDTAGSVVCVVFRFSYFFAEYASILSLAVISVERFVAIKTPMRHKTLLTPTKMTVALVLAWLDAGLISVLPFAWRRANDPQEPCPYRPTREWSIMVIVTNVFLPFTIMLCCHMYTVFYAVRNYRKRVVQHSVKTPAARGRVAFKREREITRTIAVVVGIFVICWGPSSFYYFISMVCPSCFSASFNGIRPIFNAVVKLLTFANSCVNPLIYCWINVSLRRAIYLSLSGRTGARRRRALNKNGGLGVVVVVVNPSPIFDDRALKQTSGWKTSLT